MMKYDPSHKDEYEKNAALMHIVYQKGRMLDATLTDDSMDASSEMLGDPIWSPEGLRFSLKRWHWTKNDWLHYRESDVVMKPSEIEAVLKGEALKFIKLTSKASTYEIQREMRRFSSVFTTLDIRAKEALFEYIADSDESVTWALAMQHVFADWRRQSEKQ